MITSNRFMNIRKLTQPSFPEMSDPGYVNYSRVKRPGLPWMAITVANLVIVTINLLATLAMQIAMVLRIPFPFGEAFWIPLICWLVFNTVTWVLAFFVTKKRL